MIRDAVRAALAVAVLAAAAGIVIETRHQLHVADLAYRAALAGQPMPAWHHVGQPVPPEPGPLRRVGRATLDLADAAIGVFRR